MAERVKPGDLVKEKNGVKKLTVRSVDGDMATCTDDNGTEKVVPVAALVKVTSGPTASNISVGRPPERII